MTLLDTSLLPHGGSCGSAAVFMASLDHAMWFHRPFRADEWLLYAQDTPRRRAAGAWAGGWCTPRTVGWWCRSCRRA